jgi:peptide/nickel transport system substrate-binding protein
MKTPSRLFKSVMSLAAATLILSACGQAAAPTAAPAPAEPTPVPEATAEPTAAPVEEATAAPEAPAAEPAAAGKYTEAPVLAEQVKAGTIPPLEERMPEDPFVVGPGVLLPETDVDWKPGIYGGILHSAHAVANWSPDIFVMMNEPLLSAPGLGVQNIRGNILKDFKVENDNKEFTFYLRKGLKWSDGQPVTSEDVRFVWEDIYGDEKLYPNGVPARFRTGFAPDGEPGKLEIIDDFTFKVTFAAPYGGFLRAITIEGWNGYTELLRPSHYLKQFHIKYKTLEELKPLLEENKLTDEWWNLFTLKNCNNWDMTNPKCIDYPGLYPWIQKEAGQGVMKFVRNPYYYKVDVEGKQLPYIDELVSTQMENVEMVNMKVATGDVDFLRESTALVKVPMYKEAEEKANIEVKMTDMHVDSSGLRLNQTFSDTVWREIAQNVKFRQAVSHAINRQELIDTLYYGFASMPEVTVGPENMAYDVDLANKLLDEIGLDKKDADGFRLRSDGKPLEILIEHAAWAPDIGPAAELAAQYLNAVGIKTSVKQLENNAYNQKQTNNEIQANTQWSHDQGWDSDWTQGDAGRAGQMWEQWRASNGTTGEEPPAWIKKAYELDKARWSSVSGSDEYNALKEEGYAWERENLPYINFVEQVKYPMIAKKNLGNVATAGFAIASNFAGEQLYWTDAK